MGSSFQQPPGFDLLSKAEQVKYLQDLWDLIAAHPQDVPVPQSHLELLEQRKAAFERDPANVQNAYSVIERLKKNSR